MPPEEWKMLLEQCQGATGERSTEAAHRHLHDLYYNKLYKYLLKLTQNKQRAEDLSQDTYLSVLKQLETFSDKLPLDFENYLFASARKKCCSEWTRRGREKARVDAIATGNQIHSRSQEVTLMEQEIVYRALNVVQEPYRELLILCDTMGLEYKEISDILEIPLGTVRSGIARGRMQFTQEYMRLTRIVESKELALQGEGR